MENFCPFFPLSLLPLRNKMPLPSNPSPISQLYEHVAKLSAAAGIKDPKIEYQFHYSETHNGYCAVLNVLGYTFTSDYYIGKKRAKEAVSSMALQQLAAPYQRREQLQLQQQQSNASSRAMAEPTATRIQRWLAQCMQRPHNTCTGLLAELIQVLGLNVSPRYDIQEVYHAIGGHTHAPFACTLFVDPLIFRSLNVYLTVQEAKEDCAKQALVALVQSACGLQPDLSFLTRPVTTAPPSATPSSNNQPESKKHPVVLSAFNKTDTAMLNELASRLKWERPEYIIEESVSDINSKIYLCHIKLRRSDQEQVVSGKQWLPAKAQAKHHAASIVLQQLTQEGVCIIVTTY